MNAYPYLLVLLLVAGCASEETMRAREGPERHYTGVIENVQATTRSTGGPPSGAARAALMPLMLFGAIGGAIYGAATSGGGEEVTQMQVVKLDSGATVTLISDGDFKPGECVRMTVQDAAAEPLPWYPHGQATLERIACPEPVGK